MHDFFDGWHCLFTAQKLIPNAVTVIIKRIMNCGGQVYIVGGATRQILLNLPIKDWDLATSLPPEAIESMFSDMQTVITGKKFGTVTVISDNISVEITTFRHEETYSDFRHPDKIVYVQDICIDLSRRDFTINAIAYNPYLSEPFIDPFDGCGDLAHGIIKTVGNAQERFSEDPLRIIRCVRFLSELGFVVDEQTYDALCRLSPLLAQVSRERIREEFSRLLLSPHVSDGLSILVKTGILKAILPDLFFAIGDNTSAIYQAVHSCGTDIILRLAALFYHIKNLDYMVEHSLKSLRYDNYTVKAVLEILSYSNLTWLDEQETLKYHLRKLLNNVGIEHTYRIFDLFIACAFTCSSISSSEREVRIDRSLNGTSAENIKLCRMYLTEVMHDPVKLSDLAINGHDLINAGIVADSGIELGKTLKEALDFVHHDPELNKKEILLAKLKNAKASHDLKCAPAIPNPAKRADQSMDMVE